MKNKNKKYNFNSFILIYRNSEDQVISLLEGKMISLDGKNTKGRVLMILDINLLNLGKKYFILYNFQKIIFLPIVLYKYTSLLSIEKKTHLIVQVQNVLVMCNEKAYTIFPDENISSLKNKVSGLVLNEKIIENVKSLSWGMGCITFLRKFKFLVYIINLFLFILYWGLYYNYKI